MDDLERLREYQGGRCWTCPPAPESVRFERAIGLVLDHDHVTGLVRGLLCNGCNSAEGRGALDIDWEEYRRDPPARQLGIVVRHGGGVVVDSWDAYDDANAVAMLQRGVALEDVAEATGLSVERLNGLDGRRLVASAHERQREAADRMDRLLD